MVRKHKGIMSNMWKKLVRLAQIDPSEDWQDEAAEMGIPRGEALRLMVSIQEAKKDLLLQTAQDDEVFQAWTLAEWCQLVHVLETAVGQDKMAVPLLKQCRQHPAYAVYTQLRQAALPETQTASGFKPMQRDAQTEAKMAQLEECILNHEVVTLARVNHKSIDVMPTKLIHVEGQMALICEDSHDHCLLSLPLEELTTIMGTGVVRAPHSVSLEVSEFIHALRSMSDSETRLILKIKNPAQFSLAPDHEFLGRPCLVTNPDGDVIWAAYVEPSEELFDWLDSMEGQVEILDPPSFLADYATYCEAKSRKLA